MQRSFWILAAAWLMMAATTSAQELGISDMYGRGVHAYFSGQPRAAYQYLTTAIKAGTHDPRAYYFRGLTYQQLGRPTEAQADFRTGATLEQEDVGGLFYVDRSLERVQGASRLTIEKYRAEARVGSAQAVVQERNQRIVTARAAQPQVAAPGQEVLAEQGADFGNLPAASPPVKGEVDQPFNEPALQPPAAQPKPAQANPLQENPFGQPGPPPRANPAAPPANAPGESSAEGGGTARALGNALKRALGGFSLPEVPAGLPLVGEGNAAPPAAPKQPDPNNPFDAPANPPNR
jgi:hypothetical protein